MISPRMLRKHANSAFRTTLARVPLAFWEDIFPKDIIALCYHVVSDADLPHLQLYPYKNSLQFEADVLFARDRAATYRQVADCRISGATLPKNQFLFTFDDGLAQCYDTVRPILKKHGVDGVFFITTDYVDDSEEFFESALSLCLSKIAELEARRISDVLREFTANENLAADRMRDELAKGRREATRLTFGHDEARLALLDIAFGIGDGDDRLARLCNLLDVDVKDYSSARPIFMTRAQIQELSREGFTIGAHGRKHRSHEALSFDDLEEEIVRACEDVRDITGQSRVPFAFPYSGLGIDRAILEAILRRNPIVELTFDSGCLRRDPPFVINRVFTDIPTPSLAYEQSNIPSALHGAWSVPSAWFRSA